MGIYNDTSNIKEPLYVYTSAVNNSIATWYESLEKKLKDNLSIGCDKFRIDKVIFSNPATIVIWADGTKTVVKAQNEPFDPEKGLAMAIAKKVLGNKGNYYEIFKKYIKHDDVNNG